MRKYPREFQFVGKNVGTFKVSAETVEQSSAIGGGGVLLTAQAGLLFKLGRNWPIGRLFAAEQKHAHSELWAQARQLIESEVLTLHLALFPIM